MNRRAFWLGAAMVMLCSFVAISLRSFAEAAFLSAYGPKQMPWLLIANASGFAIATLGYDGLTRWARASRVDVILLGLLAVTAAAAPTLLREGAPPVVLVVVLAAGSQVAGLALWNRVAASVAGRDARRYLPRAGAAVTLGGAIAGLGAGALIPRVGLSAVPYAGAAVTLAVICVCISQERALAIGGAPGGAPPTGGPVALSLVQRRMIAAMIAVAAFDGILSTMIDLQFVGAVKARYHGEDLAVALALFYGGTNTVLLALQSTAVPHLLVTRAMTFTAALHPAVVVASYAGFAAAPSFLGIAATRTADQVLRFATSRTSQETKLSALPPAPRARWKVLLRGVIGPAGTASAALVLFAVGPSALAAPVRLALVAIPIAIAWAVAARVAARRFRSALADPLGIRSIEREDPRRIDFETLEQWTHHAGSDNAREAALARAALARARIEPSDLADHLRHDDATVRAAMFDQLARTPAPSLRGELRAAVGIEDDDRALALGIKALAVAGDPTGITRGNARAGLSREVDTYVAIARHQLEGAPVSLQSIIDVDPGWAVTIVRERGETGGTTQNPYVLLRTAPSGSTVDLARILETGNSSLLHDLDAVAARALIPHLPGLSSISRAMLARGLGGAPSATELLACLLVDRDPEVVHAALGSAVALARGGTTLPSSVLSTAHERALAAFVAHLDARDAGTPLSECARVELDVATRRCAARLLGASALDAASSGRDPAPLAAAARHLLGTRDADRKRALDILQELQARPAVLAAVERWLRAPAAATQAQLAAHDQLGAHDAWLAALIAGEHVRLEPVLAALRRPVLFASIAGPALAALASAATVRTIEGDLFREGDAGASMFVVASGTLVATRGDGPSRRIAAGSVVGEIAVLTHAPRAATVRADAAATVYEIDRAAFTTVSRSAPELVLGLSATLAGWLAPSRPDVL